MNGDVSLTKVVHFVGLRPRPSIVRKAPNMAECWKTPLEYSNIKTWKSQLNNKDDGNNLVQEGDLCLCDRCGKIMANLMVMAAKREVKVSAPAESTQKRKEYLNSRCTFQTLTPETDSPTNGQEKGANMSTNLGWGTSHLEKHPRS